MLLSDRIVCVGIGQCGSNIVNELENLNFNAFYVNSSLEDLYSINTEDANKFHIQGAKGMAKDRNLAIECLLNNNNAENICYAINDRYSMGDIIYMVYSLSGGTGGTMGNILAEQMADLFPNKIINVIAVLPKLTEDIGLLANAIESLQHLKKVKETGAINQIHLLDNNSRDDIFSINKDFAICFDRFVNFDEVNKSGNLDEEEKERLLTESGMAVILEFSNEDFGNGIAEACDNSIYADWLKDSKLHGLILNKKQNKEVNKEVIKDVLGMALYTHQSVWEEDSNVILSVGMSFNENILVKLKKTAQELLERKKKIEEESKQEQIENVQFDTKMITNTVRKKNTDVDITQRNPRKRREKRASSLLDKYRNM